MKVVVGLLLAAFATGMFFAATMPNGDFSSSRWNFMGALLVAVGGLFGCMHAAKVAGERFASISWAFVVVGGSVIAGASYQMAVAVVPAAGQ